MEEWRGRDPLPKARAGLDPAAADAVDARVEAEIQAALQFALDSPTASEESMYLDQMAVR